jgi:ferredoxin hydrogenase
VLIKRYFAQQKGVKPEQIFNVALTPCTAKKFEIRRPEMQVDGVPGMDAVITVRELADWMRSEKLDYAALEPSQYDALVGNASVAGVIFGNTGGVTEAILRSAYALLNQTNPPESFLTFTSLRGLKGSQDARIGELKYATVQLTPSLTVKVAVVQGLARVRKVLQWLKEQQIEVDFIEVMACEGGCIGGGGTPRAKSVPYLTRAMRQARIAALYTGDTSRKIRLAHENPLLKTLYKEEFGDFGSSKAKAILHTFYTSRAEDLG